MYFCCSLKKELHATAAVDSPTSLPKRAIVDLGALHEMKKVEMVMVELLLRPQPSPCKN